MALKKIVFSICLAILVSGCGIMYKNKVPQKIRIEIDSNSVVNYGVRIPFKVQGYYADGKVKTINNHSSLKAEATTAEISSKSITPERFPLDFNDSIIHLKASFINDKVNLSDSISLPFNYKSNINLNFSGENGKNGGNGSRGNLNFLTRDGTDGKPGEDGGNGENGDDLNIFVWYNNDIYFIRIDNVTTQNSYFYKANYGSYTLQLDVSGGDGGDGGNGGKGANGKDAERKDGKTKNSGQGGHGGNGGNGGMGGSPGNVYVYIHPTAIGFEKRIRISQKVGQGGKIGEGNSGGTGGKEIDSDLRNIKGQDGYNGIEGQAGQNNNVINMEVLDFDILNYKPN